MEATTKRVSVAPLLLVLAIALFLAGMRVSKHATISHTWQKWHAETISQEINSGRCKPLVYHCADKTYMLCPTSGGFAGLVIGYEGGPTIITGFEAREEYWKKKVAGCTLGN